MEVNKVYNSDCLKEMKKLEDSSVDLIVTSPPYYNAREYSQWDSYQDYLESMTKVVKEGKRVLKDGRMMVINVSPVIEARKSRQDKSKRRQIPFDLYGIAKKEGLELLEDIIWEKPNYTVKNRNGGFFRHRKPVAYKPNLVHEYILVFQKPTKYLIDKILKDNKDRVKDSLVKEDDYEKTSIWKIKPKKDKEHSAVFPMSLPTKIIKYYSFKGDVVLDMFIGSGTTAIACIETGRKYIGYELNKSYYELCLQRIEEYEKE